MLCFCKKVVKMSSKSEKAKELFKSGYNCSQAVLGVFCEEMGLDFDTAMKISSSFGGGMGRMREVCGTVSGMFMAAGLAFSASDNSAENKKQQYQHVQELAKRFKDENGSIICRELLEGINVTSTPTPEARTENYYKKRPCAELVACAVEILEDYLEKCTNNALNKELKLN